MSGSEPAAVIAYESGDVYKVRGWTTYGATKTIGPYKRPGTLLRLGPTGWHTLELFNSTGDELGSGLMERDELIAYARDLIETTYENPGAEVRNIRTFPFRV